MSVPFLYDPRFWPASQDDARRSTKKLHNAPTPTGSMNDDPRVGLAYASRFWPWRGWQYFRPSIVVKKHWP